MGGVMNPSTDLDVLQARISAFMEREYEPANLPALLDGLSDEACLLLILARHHVEEKVCAALLAEIKRKEGMA